MAWVGGLARRIRGSDLRRAVAIAAGVKISASRFASSRHFVSSPLRRTASASPSRRFRVSISVLEFADRPRRRRLVEDLFLGGFDFVVRRILQILDIFCIERRRPASRTTPDLRRRVGGLQLAQTAFKPLLAPAQRLINRFRRRGQPALKDGQCETDRARALVVLQGFRAIELFAHVVGHRLVELRLAVGQFVGTV